MKSIKMYKGLGDKHYRRLVAMLDDIGCDVARTGNEIIAYCHTGFQAGFVATLFKAIGEENRLYLLEN